jgi:hypothetical protein
MSTYNTIVGTPTPTPLYMQGFNDVIHPDGAFFCLLCVASWVLFIWMWAWNHKPRRKPHKPLLPKEPWETPTRWN